MQYRMGDYEEAVVAYIRAAEMGMEIGQSNAAWMLSRGYGAQGPAAATLAMKLHQRAAGQVCTCLHMFCAHAHYRNCTCMSAGHRFPKSHAAHLHASLGHTSMLMIREGRYCTSMLQLGLLALKGLDRTGSLSVRGADTDRGMWMRCCNWATATGMGGASTGAGPLLRSCIRQPPSLAMPRPCSIWA